MKQDKQAGCRDQQCQGKAALVPGARPCSLPRSPSTALPRQMPALKPCSLRGPEEVSVAKG